MARRRLTNAVASAIADGGLIDGSLIEQAFAD